MDADVDVDVDVDGGLRSIQFGWPIANRQSINIIDYQLPTMCYAIAQDRAEATLLKQLFAQRSITSPKPNLASSIAPVQSKTSGHHSRLSALRLSS